MKNMLICHFFSAIEMDPTNAVYFCNRAAARSKLNKHHEAIEDCTTALMLDPSYSKAYGRLGYDSAHLIKTWVFICRVISFFCENV